VKSSKRRCHTAESRLDNSAECKRLVAIIGGILRSTDGVEFVASVAGTGMSLPEYILCNMSNLVLWKPVLYIVIRVNLQPSFLSVSRRHSGDYSIVVYCSELVLSNLIRMMGWEVRFTFYLAVIKGHQSWWVDFYLSCFFSVRISLMMKLSMNGMRARGYRVTEWILNICINYGN